MKIRIVNFETKIEITEDIYEYYIECITKHLLYLRFTEHQDKNQEIKIPIIRNHIFIHSHELDFKKEEIKYHYTFRFKIETNNEKAICVGYELKKYKYTKSEWTM